MKELDVLLDSFLRSQELALERGEWPGLESLLALEDDVLWDYLQAPACAPERFAGLIDGIRGRHVPTC
jgi:succinate dehydrogenase flavin-adding protein (antitoxin of CptAB toxin-antitoxin module)